MRKVTLKVKTRTMVPIIHTLTIVADVDEGHSMEALAKSVASGPIPDWATLQDSGYGDAQVEGHDDPKDTDLEDQICDYVQTAGVKTDVLEVETEDSR